MKQQCRRRVIKAWMLLLALMPMMVVKAVHHHPHVNASCGIEIPCHDMHHGSTGDDSGSECFICQFTLSPFEQAYTYEYHSPVLFIYVQPLVSFEAIILRPIHICGWRAPPFYA